MLMQWNLLIGIDFLNTVCVNIVKGKITISKLVEEMREESNESSVPEVFKIDCMNNKTEVDLLHIPSAEHRSVVEKLILSYEPKKMEDSPVIIKFLLKDNEPIYQRRRRLSPFHRQEVNSHIEKWLNDSIIQPSFSEYCEPCCGRKKQ